MTPFLIAVMGVSAPTAVGTDMVFATMTKFTGSLQHYRQQSVNLEIAASVSEASRLASPALRPSSGSRAPSTPRRCARS